MQVREFDLKSLDKLLPCPFCGADAELDTHQGYRSISDGRIGNRVVVYCTKCDADMGTCVEDVPDIHPNEVIERWNRRADTSALAARLRSMEEALQLIANCIHPKFRTEEDIDLLYANEKAFGQCINVARAAISGEGQ